MKSYKRIIAGFLAIATLSSNIITASAELSSEPAKVSFIVRWLHSIAVRSDGMKVQDIPIGRFLASMVSDLSHGTVCEFSDDHWHHADESDYVKVSEGKDGTYGVRAKCKYCHKEFAVGGLTADDLSSKYNDYVSNLPASGYNSAGKLLWQPRWSDVDSSAFRIYVNSSLSLVECNGSTLTVGGNENYRVSVSGARISIDCLLQSSVKFYFKKASGEYIRFKTPISGYYTRMASPFYASRFETSGGTFETLNYDYTSAGRGLYSAGSYLSGLTSSEWSLPFPKYNAVRGFCEFYTPIYSVEPADASLVSNNYTINTRVNNFNGDYYDSVTNNYYNNTTIINETTNNYYDMTTNNYYTMSNWSYDYQSRTYFVTLEDGTTITVQFGDDCLTITNNNVENSYQYVIKNGGGTGPDTPTACKHNWTETIDVAPTCLEGGHANYTCSLCGETYEQILSAKGHNWTVKEHVNTVYGENGQIVTQGHTLYECSACGEQWYTETAAPPPDVSGGSNVLTWLQEFKTWLGDKLDNLFQGDGDTNNFWSTNKKSFTDVLSSLLQTLLDFLTDILEKLLGLVKDLLSFLFDLISSVVITGISDFFTGLKDSRLFDFVVKDDEGFVTALPEGVATVFAFFSGVILALPVELRSILLFGTAIIVLIGVIKIIKS